MSRYNYEVFAVENMVGLVFRNVYQKGDDCIIFEYDDDNYIEFSHFQDCCEHVYIESVVGDLTDLAGTPIFMARESVVNASVEEAWESATATFYNFATLKGYVDVRWIGESNGYYSESVDIQWHGGGWDNIMSNK